MLSKTVGSYKIIEKIAFGGMGVVYKGIHTKLEQFVAIKVLSPQFASNQNMKSKFLSEAKIQAQLHHPNVVNIMNFIEEDDEQLKNPSGYDHNFIIDGEIKLIDSPRAAHGILRFGQQPYTLDAARLEFTLGALVV